MASDNSTDYSGGSRSPKSTSPVGEAVQSAVDSSKMSDRFPDDLVSHITEQVLKALQSNGYDLDHSAESIYNSSGPRQRDLYTPPLPEEDKRPSNKIAHPFDNLTDLESGRFHDHVQGRSELNNVLENAWQPLFGEDGQPTPRMRSFLRGIANHIIEEFEPKSSVVISPRKMLAFYESTPLSFEEVYPWKSIFGGVKMRNSSISHLYRDLGCRHHYVQPSPIDKPSIPCLTPDGFETWMIHTIQSNPEDEYERLSKITSSMQIRDPQDSDKLFPRELPKQLFLFSYDEAVRENFESSILADRIIDPAEIRHRRGSIPVHPPPAIERPRPRGDSQDTLEESVTSLTSHAVHIQEPNVDDKTDEGPSMVGIERQRKPYSVVPGRGKVYDSQEPHLAKSTKAPGSPQKARSRANSLATTDSYNPPARRMKAYSEAHPPAPEGLTSRVEEADNTLRRTRSERSRRYNPSQQGGGPPRHRSSTHSSRH